MAMLGDDAEDGVRVAADYDEPDDETMRRGGAVDEPRVCIIGCGVSGLSTALSAIEDGILSGRQITIIAEKVYAETTSYIAAGFFSPNEDLGPDLDTAERWYRDTYEHYKRLHKLGMPQKTGVRKRSGYHLSSYVAADTLNRINERIFDDLRTLTDEEMKKFPKQYKYGTWYTTYIADPAKYLKYLEGELRRRGVQFIQHSISDFSEVGQRFPIVVNCTGLGSRQLANDNRMVPIRGQVVKVRNKPEVTHFIMADDFYILPGVDWVTLGGTRTFNDTDLRVSQRDRAHILKGCHELLPSLKNNEELVDLVGLRPYRSPVRIEIERRFLAGTAAPQQRTEFWLVHNYGHGGQGVNLSWGTARETAGLIRQCVARCAAKSRL